jgi:hypothetical protein
MAGHQFGHAYDSQITDTVRRIPLTLQYFPKDSQVTALRRGLGGLRSPDMLITSPPLNTNIENAQTHAISPITCFVLQSFPTVSANALAAERSRCPAEIPVFQGPDLFSSLPLC